MPATGPQIVAARSLLQWNQTELAERSKVAVSTIKRLEAMPGPSDSQRDDDRRHSAGAVGCRRDDAQRWRLTDGGRAFGW